MSPELVNVWSLPSDSKAAKKRSPCVVMSGYIFHDAARCFLVAAPLPICLGHVPVLAGDPLWRISSDGWRTLSAGALLASCTASADMTLSLPWAPRAACVLRAPTNESWAENIFLDDSKTFLQQTVSSPRETLSPRCDPSQVKGI